MSDHSAMIAEFSSVTGADADRAQFFLESSGWDLNMAMASFFDDNDEPQIIPDEAPEETPPSGAAQSESKQTTSGRSAPSRFATLDSYRHEEKSDSSEEEGEAFYAGGSERSGQQILGPAKKKKDANKLVDDMFKAAKDHGAEEVGDEEAPRRRPVATFRGTGYRLGDTEEPSLSVPGFSAASGRPQQVNMVLKLWKNGFSVDDGELRDYQNPDNKEFLAAIKKGEVPRELVRQARGGEVNLNMEDHREEDFLKPKVKAKPFTGEGRRLGSPAGGAIEAGGDQAPSASQVSAASGAADVAVEVDSSKPQTSVQIRLADGSRLVSKFNHGHTVSDVRQHIIASRPQFSAATFVLMTTFPNRELSDESQTLEQAGLLNAVLVQRVK